MQVIFCVLNANTSRCII